MNRPALQKLRSAWAARRWGPYLRQCGWVIIFAGIAWRNVMAMSRKGFAWPPMIMTVVACVLVGAYLGDVMEGPKPRERTAGTTAQPQDDPHRLQTQREPAPHQYDSYRPLGADHDTSSGR